MKRQHPPVLPADLVKIITGRVPALRPVDNLISELVDVVLPAPVGKAHDGLCTGRNRAELVARGDQLPYSTVPEPQFVEEPPRHFRPQVTDCDLNMKGATDVALEEVALIQFGQVDLERLRLGRQKVASCRARLPDEQDLAPGHDDHALEAPVVIDTAPQDTHGEHPDPTLPTFSRVAWLRC